MNRFKKIIYFFVLIFILNSNNVFAADNIKRYPVPDVEKRSYSTAMDYNISLYNSVLKGIMNLQDKVDTSMYSKDSDVVFNTLEKVLDDHPEIFYFDYEKSSFWSNGVLELGYKEDKITINTMKQQLNNKVQSIINNVIKPDMSELEKEMAIHDYVVLNTKYDVDGVESANISDLIFTSYGCLVKNICVCDGYAKAMQLLLNKVGVYTIRVTGTSAGENHAWNIVRIDGKNYHVDATWNDPVPDMGYVRYKYLNLSDEDISKDHNWIRKGVPICYDNSFRYFHKLNYIVKDEEYIYYSNEEDENILYKMRLDGSENKKLSEDMAVNLVYYNNYIYFSNYSDGGNLYRVNNDGNDLEKILDNHVENIHVIDGYLTYYNEDIGKHGKIKLEDYINDHNTTNNDGNGENPTDAEDKFKEVFKNYKLWEKTKTVPYNKIWKITFNRELGEQSIEEKVYVLDSDFNKLTDIDININGCKNLIITKKTPYKRGGLYYLVVSKPIKDIKGQEIKEPIVMRFKVY